MGIGIRIRIEMELGLEMGTQARICARNMLCAQQDETKVKFHSLYVDILSYACLEQSFIVSLSIIQFSWVVVLPQKWQSGKSLNN